LIQNVNTHRSALHIERIRTHVQKHWIKATVEFINFFVRTLKYYTQNHIKNHITHTQSYKTLRVTKRLELQNTQSYKILRVTKYSELQNTQSYKILRVTKYSELQC